jgi:NAD-dependent dihydropyrimidine dehydrogenase PreA subunit
VGLKVDGELDARVGNEGRPCWARWSRREDWPHERPDTRAVVQGQYLRQLRRDRRAPHPRQVTRREVLVAHGPSPVLDQHRETTPTEAAGQALGRIHTPTWPEVVARIPTASVRPLLTLRNGVKDNLCVEVCPVDCIHPTPDEPDCHGKRRADGGTGRPCGRRTPRTAAAAWQRRARFLALIAFLAVRVLTGTALAWGLPWT